MKTIRIEKVTLNIGAGTNQDHLKKAIKLIEALTGKTPIKTVAKKRMPAWGLRPGLPIGCKLTLRGKEAEDIVKRLLDPKENTLGKGCFDTNGNVSFGLSEYIEVPGLNYDPTIGIMGIQCCITLERPGFRIKRRKIHQKKIPSDHSIHQEDSIAFFREKFGVKLEEEE